MDVSLILRVAGIALLVTVTCQVLSKSGREEHALLVTLTGMLLILLSVIGQLSEVIEQLRAVFGL